MHLPVLHLLSNVLNAWQVNMAHQLQVAHRLAGQSNFWQWNTEYVTGQCAHDCATMRKL